jgi:hypothetical protein
MDHLPLRTLRLIVLAATAFLVLIMSGMMVLLGFDSAAGPIWLTLPVIIGLAFVVLVPALGSSIRPLSLTTTEQQARQLSPGMLQSVTFVRLGMAAGPASFGLAGAAFDGSAWPMVAGLAFSVLLLLAFVYPRDAVVDAFRDRLEANGAKSWLWEALSEPAPR